jgi:antitoxin component YwqK of YwqJK toxin-antitoxin module
MIAHFCQNLKQYFFWLLLFCALSSSAQPTKNQRDAQGRKQGYWEAVDREGKLVYSGTFKDDKPVGEMKRYHPKGGVRVIMLHKENSTKAYSRFFWQNGELAAEGNYIGNKRDSLWTFYSYHTHKLSYQQMYENGMRNGKSQSFYATGSINEELSWVNDRKEGDWRQFFESGQLKMTATYRNNQLEGDYTVYYPDGKKETAGQYRNGLPDGDWTYYNPNGNVATVVAYKNGKISNEEKLTEEQQKFFEKIEAKKGTIKEPDIEDFMK